MKIYLASKSPRRKELLEGMGIDFEVLFLDTPELVRPGESAAAYSARVTQEKLTASWQKVIDDNLELMPVLCADTDVVLDNKILGKPRDGQDAFETIKSYSGKAHEVLTSVGLKYFDYEKLVTHKTIIEFAHIADSDIKHYLATWDYKDKAGSYGIRSYIGQFISRIDGCFYSVMGLPLNEVRLLLADFSKFQL